MEYSHVDAIMVGRAALGNPWIFKQINEYLKNGKILTNVTNEEKLDTIIKHLELEIAERGEISAVKEMRKHISAYTKNLPNSSEFRSKINSLNTKNEVEDELKSFFASL